MKNKNFKILIFTIILSIGLWFLLTYKILEVPPGITADESAFGLNGALLAKTLKDENGAFLPVFVLSLDGKDWRQPVTQYLTAITFKIFSPSFFALRAGSVFLAIVGVLLLFYLLNKMGGFLLGLFGVIFYIFTPLIFIQSHMGLDNIAPVPFAALWLLAIYLFEKTKQKRFLILAGVALGIAFYTYKAMRIISIEWIVISLVYLVTPLYKLNLRGLFKSEEFKNTFKNFLVFGLSLLPFFIIIPYLQKIYPGAILGGQRASIDSYQQFFLGYLSNMDFSNLFIKGDATYYHSTGRHGALLLASLPFFLIGAYQSVKQRGFLCLVLASFLITPLFFGLVGSLDRASRLLALIPAYTIICAVGAFVFWVGFIKLQNSLGKYLNGLVVFLLFGFLVFNSLEFVYYYLNQYPSYYKTQEAFKTQSHGAYVALSEEARKRNLRPLIEEDIYSSEWVTAKFFEQAYFNEPLTLWKRETDLPSKSILLTNAKEVMGGRRLDLNLPAYNLVISE